MGDHGSPAEPPPASEPTWLPPAVGYEAISEEHNVATAAGGGTQDANCEAPERMSTTYSSTMFIILTLKLCTV